MYRESGFIMEKSSALINVELDENATIVSINCKADNQEFNCEAYIGENWFLKFIEPKNFKEVLAVFNGLIYGDTKKC